MRFRIGRDKTDGRAAFARAARAADAVRVVDGGTGQVVVDDGRQAGDVDAARGHVGGDQHLQAPRLEVGQQLAARALAEFAVECAHVQSRALQLVGHVFGRVLGGDEHQHALPLLLQDQVAQQLRAARHVDRDGALHDVGLVLRFGRHLDAHGFREQAVGQRLHAVGEGGGKEQVLPLLGQQRQDGVDFFAETHVQQAVGLIEHEQRHAAQFHGILPHQVQQTARRGDDDVGAAAQVHHLRVDRHAAEQHGDLQLDGQRLGQRVHRLPHLRRQLARGHEDQRAHLARAGSGRHQCLQQRQRVGGRLAGTRLRGAQHVAAAQDGGNGGRLDSRRRGIAGLLDGADQGGNQTQGGKWHSGPSLFVK